MNEPDLDSGPSLWSDPWIRAGLIHPFFYVAPWVLLCFLLASLPGSDIGYVAWGFWVIPLSAVASLVATVVMVVRSMEPGAVRLGVAALGLLMSSGALVAGFYFWLATAEIACHGGYECPF